MRYITDFIIELQQNYSSILYPDESKGRAFPSISYIDTKDAHFTNVFGHKVPEDLQSWWEKVNEAVLFKDVLYGQWGLNILSIERAKQVTQTEIEGFPLNYYPTDIIIGEFYGDVELLLISCEEGRNFGKIYVVLETYGRKDWPMVANSFTEFITKYIQEEGNKFWD